MKTIANSGMDPGLKSTTVPFIGRCLKSMGMNATRDGDFYYVDLGYDSNLVIGFRRGRISVAVVMPAGWEEMEEQLLLASMTMASTLLTKVFLSPEGEEMNIWFSAESLCKTRGEFEGVFDTLFKQLMKSVRTFVEIRERIAEGMQACSMATLMMSEMENQPPS